METPRIISGYIFEPDVYVAALSELNFHLVNTHFQHPDDVLDEDRGAKLGWKKCMEESVSIWSGCMILHPQSEI